MNIPKKHNNTSRRDKERQNVLEEEKSFSVLAIEEGWAKKRSISQSPATPIYKTNFDLDIIKSLNSMTPPEMRNILLQTTISNKSLFKEPDAGNSNSKQFHRSGQSSSMCYLQNGIITGENYYYTCAFDAFTSCILNITEFIERFGEDNDFISLIKALPAKNMVLAKEYRFSSLVKLYGLKRDCTSNITTVSNFV